MVTKSPKGICVPLGVLWYSGETKLREIRKEIRKKQIKIRNLKLKIVKVTTLVSLIFVTSFSVVACFNRNYTFKLGYDRIERKYDLIYSDGTGSAIITLEVERHHRNVYHRRLYINTFSSEEVNVIGITNITCTTYLNGWRANELIRNFGSPQNATTNMAIMEGIGRNDNITIKGQVELMTYADDETHNEKIEYQLAIIILYNQEDIIYIDLAMVLL